jgi:hypothetical protein
MIERDLKLALEDNAESDRQLAQMKDSTRVSLVVVCIGDQIKVWGSWNYPGEVEVWLKDFHCRDNSDYPSNFEDWHCDNGTPLIEHHVEVVHDKDFVALPGEEVVGVLR